jgi:hypothetical protein
MAKTLEAVLKEQIGNMVFQIASMNVEIETARERIAELEAQVGAQFIAPSKTKDVERPN